MDTTYIVRTFDKNCVIKLCCVVILKIQCVPFDLDSGMRLL